MVFLTLKPLPRDLSADPVPATEPFPAEGRARATLAEQSRRIKLSRWKDLHLPSTLGHNKSRRIGINTQNYLEYSPTRRMSKGRLDVIRIELEKHPEKIAAVERVIFGLAASPVPVSSDDLGRKGWPGQGDFKFNGTFLTSPTAAPRLWPGAAEAGEPIVDFLSREYAPLIGRSLHRGHLMQLDKSALLALREWENHRHVRWLTLPTLPEYNLHMQHWIDTVGADAAKLAIPRDDLKKILRARAARSSAPNLMNGPA